MTDSTKLIERLKAAALAATPQHIDGAEKIEVGIDGQKYIECPHCGGEGSVNLEADYCNYDDVAIGVQFYGIGNEFGAAEAYFRAASPAAILDLIALIEQQAAALEAANARIAEIESERDALLAAAGKEAVKITEPAQVAGSVFRAGISCDTVIKAAQRNYKYRNDPAVQDYPDRFTLAQIQAMDSIVPQGDREFVSLKDYQAAALEKGDGRDAVTDAQVEAALAAFNAFPCPENGSVVRTWDTDQMRAALLAALAQPLEAQADARDERLLTLYEVLMQQNIETSSESYLSLKCVGVPPTEDEFATAVQQTIDAALSQKAGEQQ